MAHIPTDAAFINCKYLVMLAENTEIETSDTNLVMTYEKGIYCFFSKHSAESFTRSLNSANSELPAIMLAKQKEPENV